MNRQFDRTAILGESHNAFERGASVVLEGSGNPKPLSQEQLAGIRAHPGFRDAVRTYAAANVAGYQSLDHMQRWMHSDMGRASLSGAVWVLYALGRLTPAALMASRPVVGGEVSLTRARLYLRRALANGLIQPATPGAPMGGDTPLSPDLRFVRSMTAALRVAIQAAADILPEAAAAQEHVDDPAFVQLASGQVGLLLAAHPHLFPLDCPVQRFQSRDGGARLLEQLVLRGDPGSARLLERCSYSHAALARGSRCSRAQVIQLLQDGEVWGYLSVGGGRLSVSPELSDDVERYFAALFATVGRACGSTLTQGWSSPSIEADPRGSG